MGQSAPVMHEAAAASLAASRQDILFGLTAAQKRLSPKYLYDERGSQLFDEICSLPEYYPTRTELELLRANAAELAALVGPRAEIVELGAGSSLKACRLLTYLREPARYLPVDISAEYLKKQAAEVAGAFPSVAVEPVLADFTRPFTLPRQLARERTLVFFPGSTIGNLSRSHAAALLASLATRLGGQLLIGVDICREAPVLHPAYNDSSGVTAAFNLNVLARLRLKGFGLSVDDFGTGYSSLSQLSQIPFTELKIDQGFVTGAANQPRKRAVVEASLELARKLNLSVVAEGVESIEEWQMLAELGCTYAQGYLISRPVAGDQLAEVIARWRRPETH